MEDTFRKVYTPITEEQKKHVLAIKEKADELLTLIGKAEDRSEKSRCLAIAKTNLETTIMWAVKGHTTAQNAL